MLTTILDFRKIAKAQALFEKAVLSRLPRKLTLNVGHQGASFVVEANTDDHLWFATSKIGSRFWNPFGILSGRKFENIIVEINSPLSGVDRRIGGGFAESEGCFPAVFHRGKIGGGRSGIGKSAFLGWYSSRPGARLVQLNDHLPKPVTVILIGHCSDPNFFNSLLHFVKEVKAFKRSSPLNP
jgi:5-methylcytosine-specific restriction protein A